MASSPPNDDSLIDQGWLKTRTAWASVASDDNQVAEQEEARRKAMAARVPEHAQAAAEAREVAEAQAAAEVQNVQHGT